MTLSTICLGRLNNTSHFGLFAVLLVPLYVLRTTSDSTTCDLLEPSSKYVIYTSKFSVLANHYSVLEKKTSNNLTLHRSIKKNRSESEKKENKPVVKKKLA